MADLNFNAESGSDTVHRLLDVYRIGEKIRRLRLRKKISLVDLGRHTGLSASMLSQLETGRMTPTLPTLARISMVFDVGLDHFFDDDERRKKISIVRRENRLRFPDRADSPSPAYFFECLAFSASDKGMQAYLADFAVQPSGPSADHVHEGEELIFVLTGQLGVIFGGEEFLLNQGDSAYFDSSQPHGYRGMGEQPARALVVTSVRAGSERA